MPAFWTHIIAGELIKDEIDKPAFKNLLNQNKKLYNFGCQGPDFLYYNNFWPWIKDKRGNKAGGELHADDIKPLFLLSIDYIKEELEQGEFNNLLIYFCGFVTHYVVDLLFHKCILDITQGRLEHNRLEVKLDAYLVKKMWGKEAYALNPPRAVDLGPELPAAIEDFYKKILTERSSYNLNLDYISASYIDYKKLLNMLYTPGFFKRKIFNFINYFLPWDFKEVVYPLETKLPVFEAQLEQEFSDILSRVVDISVRLLISIYNYSLYQISAEQLENLIDNIKNTIDENEIPKEKMMDDILVNLPG